jgi:cystathionine beta-lyase/cystathionine gamma-synthase
MFEKRLAALEGAERAVATSSGMAAIMAVAMSFLKLGDHVICSRAVFGAGYHYGSRGEREVRVINEVVEKVVLETIYEDRIKYVDRVKTVEKLVPQIVEREVYKNVCMDEDGLKVFNTYIGVR